MGAPKCGTMVRRRERKEVEEVEKEKGEVKKQ
jgi:hypothetical protein